MGNLLYPGRFGVAGPANGLLNDLLHFYNLNEASGNRVDSHGSADLTEQGGTVPYDAGFDGADFDFGPTLTFGDGVTTGVSITGTEFTIAWWCNLDLNNTAGFYDIGGTGASGGVAWSSYLIGAASFVRVFTDGIQLQEGGTLVPLTTTKLVAHTYDGTDHKIWVDGVEQATANPGAVGGFTTKRLQIGLGDDDGSPRGLNGRLKRFGIWDTALSPALMTAFYNGGTPLDYSDLTT